MVRKIIITLINIFSGIVIVFGQISEGGTPRVINVLKRASPEVHYMPLVSNELLRWEAEQERYGSDLKPLRFAHTFEVNIDPLNFGNWSQSDDGWWVWQMHICSENAWSLNLIFEEFYPGIRDRLFLFAPGHSHILGSFGSGNITESGTFPVSPVPGDELIVQFETPHHPGTYVPFKITRINHDFLGIAALNKRRPLGKAGDCISDVNCDLADPWRNLQNSVCRIMIGNELCTGTLVNNTAQNQRPFILTANHCISTKAKANSSLFLFNYESPYCGPLDGDVTNSLSGSTLRATHDSLDFSLVELSVIPPPHFRPFYAGWNRNTVLQDTTGAIHHSQGDIKKITVDYDNPVFSSFGNTSGYTPNGFWRINKWEFGALEGGASGGPLFNTKDQIIGSLVGGPSRCGYPFNDYFARFDLAWDRNPDSTRQLKYWLDPLKVNPATLGSKLFNEGPDFCKGFSNMTDGDTHDLLRISPGGADNKGYWTGTNNDGITEVAEQFRIPGDEMLHGVSVGIGKKFLKTTQSLSRLRVSIYNLLGGQVEIIHTQQVLLRDLAGDAMNYIAFSEAVTPSDSFLVAFNFDGIIQGDTVAIYHSIRNNNAQNSIYIKKNEQWIGFSSLDKAGALALELVACNVSSHTTDTTKIDDPLEVRLYPNPTSGSLEISSSKLITDDMISVYNIQGRQVSFKSARLTPRKMVINLSENSSGIYLIRVWDGVNHFAGKIILAVN